MNETNLILSIGGFPPLSARGCQQTLEPIKRGDLKRTVNGDVIYMGRPSHDKYQSVISCQDKEAPLLGNLWQGQKIEVFCIQRLWQRAKEQTTPLHRPAREGSIVVLQGSTRLPYTLKEGSVTLESWTDKETLMIGYQPILRMYLVTFTLNHQEWEQTTGWTLSLTEA